MARLARTILPGIPHHVTQRGNGRQQTFFEHGDYAPYRELLRNHAAIKVTGAITPKLIAFESSGLGHVAQE